MSEGHRAYAPCGRWTSRTCDHHRWDLAYVGGWAQIARGRLVRDPRRLEPS